MGGRYVYLIFYGTPIFFGGVCARYDSGIHFRNPLYTTSVRISQLTTLQTMLKTGHMIGKSFQMRRCIILLQDSDIHIHGS